MPTTWPLSLMAVAAEAESPRSGRSGCSWFLAGPQTTASNPSTWLPMQVGSWNEVSAQPATWPLALAPAAYPLLPPRIGNGVIAPSRQTNPTQVWPVVGMNAAQLQLSPSGSTVDVSEIPTTARAA